MTVSAWRRKAMLRMRASNRIPRHGQTGKLSLACGRRLYWMGLRSMSSPTRPSFGDVWIVDLEPIRGHEQGGTRPAGVVSTDALNHAPADLGIVAPLTRAARGVR